MEKEVDGYFVVLAPNYPNWLVLTRTEYRMFVFLKNGTIRNAMERYFRGYFQDENTCLAIMTGLLTQIQETNFYRTASARREIPIEKIEKRVHLCVTNNCNLRCIHCYMSAGMKPVQNIDVGSVVRLLDELREKSGKLEIVVSGGEPLIFAEIYELLEALRNDSVILFTNGTMISKRNVEHIVACCDEVQISIEGVSQPVYEQVRGEGNYVKMLRALDLLMEYQMRIVLAVTVLPNTLRDIKENLLEFVKRLKYQHLEIRLNSTIEKTGNARFMDFSGYDVRKVTTELRKVLQELCKFGCVVQRGENRNIQFTNCGIGTNLVIDCDGRIYPCHKFSDIHLSLKNSCKDIICSFNKINRETSNDKIEKCRFCELRYICSGGCRIDNYLQNGDLKVVSCDETYKMRQYSRLVQDYLMEHMGEI